MTKAKKSTLKIVFFVVFILALCLAVYFIFFNKIPAWDDLTDEEKISEFNKAISGGGSVYIRPGTNEFDTFVEDIKNIYLANGVYFDEDLFNSYYNSVNGNVYIKPGATLISVFDKPGSTKIV
jgi:hypothetical protein